MVIFDFVLLTVLIGFNGWNWYLTLNGLTNVEWWASKPERYQFSFKSASDNLFLFFGTNKYFRVLSPSLRNVPFTGLEWSFLMRDLGYSNTGIKIAKDIEHTEAIELTDGLAS